MPRHSKDTVAVLASTAEDAHGCFDENDHPNHRSTPACGFPCRGKCGFMHGSRWGPAINFMPNACRWGNAGASSFAPCVGRQNLCLISSREPPA